MHSEFTQEEGFDYSPDNEESFELSVGTSSKELSVGNDIFAEAYPEFAKTELSEISPSKESPSEKIPPKTPKNKKGNR